MVAPAAKSLTSWMVTVQLYRGNAVAARMGVRCPGHTIQFMRFGYGEYVERVLELAGVTRKLEMEEYEPWDPY